ncbi:rapamycin-insensitive companion of mTOR-like [Ornithodoros turicata]|uniref:rapamycin-insensitive companion of mTOR-like n=1 Tax=Ornithodoros turicata TaxID=34597 RepID=UPI0031397422
MAHVMFRPRSSRGARSLRKRHDSEEDTVHLDLTKGVADNLREILIYLVRKDGVSKNRKLAYLNCLVKLSSKITSHTDLGFTLEEVFCCLRILLIHEACEVRAGCLRALRHLVKDEPAARALIAVHVPILVARSLDVALEGRTERLQALRLVRRLVVASPQSVPPQLVRSLVAIAADGARERDVLVRACLGTLCELALLNPKLCCETGGFGTLIRAVLDCPQPHIAEAILSVVFHTINDPSTRHLLKLDVELEFLVAPFTDSHFRFVEELPENSMSDDRELRFQTSRVAITTILRSWPGMIYFCKPPPSGLQSLIEILHLPYPEVRNNILAVFYDAFCLTIPETTSDFDEAVRSSDRSAMQESWQLYQGFVAAEGKDLLPPVAKHRSNLVWNYLALLLLAFIQAGILEALVEVIVSSDDATLATILLAELLHMANIFLPADSSHHCHCLPSLMLRAASDAYPAEERIRASTAVIRLSKIHARKKKGIVPCSLFLDQLLQSCNVTKHGRRFFSDCVGKTKLLSCMRKDADDTVIHSIKDTQVLTEDYSSWDWELISSILKWPGESLKSLSDSVQRSFIKRLLFFFKPSNKQFSHTESQRPRSHHMVVVGCHFFEFLLEAEESKVNDYIEDFLIDLCNCLHEVEGEAVSLSTTLSPSRMTSTVAQTYFLFLGRMSSSSKGVRYLEKLGVYQHLVSLVSMTSQDVYMKLVVSSLDYSKSGFARTLFTKVLTASSETSRLYATNYLRLLLRAGLLDFRKWAVELLVNQLQDRSRAVFLAASEILDEACDVPANLEALIALRPSLLSLGDSGLLLQLRFASLPSGFKYLQEANVLEDMLSKWDKVTYLKYVMIVEDDINQAVTRHQRGEDGTYGRRSSNTRHKVQDVFTPTHLYGQLAQHNGGLQFLLQHGNLSTHWDTVRAAAMDTVESILQLKAALWTLGNVATSSSGFALLMEADVISVIAELAQEAPVYSIRGTCFYVLCLMATTPGASSVLSSLGWESVQHPHGEQWPIATFNEEPATPPLPPHRPHAWSISSVGSHMSEVLSANALHRRFHGSIASSLNDEHCLPSRGSSGNLADNLARRTMHFVAQQHGESPHFRYAQTLPRNVTLSPRHDPVVSSRRPRSSSDCREQRDDVACAPEPSVQPPMTGLSVPDVTKDGASSFGGSKDSGTDASLGDKSPSNLEVWGGGTKGERSDSNESAHTAGTSSKSRSDSCTDSTTSGVSSCEEVPRAAQTLSPIASSTSLSTLEGRTRQEVTPAVPARRPSAFPAGAVRSVNRLSTGSSPMSPESPYTTARDAAGYATLRSLRAASAQRRRRVCSLGGGADVDVALGTDVPFTSQSLDHGKFFLGDDPLVEVSSEWRCSSVASGGSHSSGKSCDGEQEVKYMGLCLPVDTRLIFTVQEAYRPRPAEVVCPAGETSTTVASTEERTDGLELHTPESCLLCHRVAPPNHTRTSGTLGDGGVATASGLNTALRRLSPDSPVPSDSQAAPSPYSLWCRRQSEGDYDVVAVRKEMLKYITNLSSSVVIKGSEQALLSLKQKYPAAFRDMCLYSEMCLLMAHYRFRLSSRTFIQELFLDLDFEQFNEEAERILRIPHVIVMPPAEESEA